MFSALKSDMANKVHHWYKINPGRSLDKYTLIEATLPSFEATLGDGNTVRQSFRICGLDGWNPENVNLSILSPSLVFVGDNSAEATSLQPAEQPVDVSHSAEDLSPPASQPGAEPPAVNIPFDVTEKITALDKELMEGDITQKGYKKKKSTLLAPFLFGKDFNLEILDRAVRAGDGDQSSASSSLRSNIIGDVRGGNCGGGGGNGGGGGVNSGGMPRQITKNSLNMLGGLGSYCNGGYSNGSSQQGQEMRGGGFMDNGRGDSGIFSGSNPGGAGGGFNDQGFGKIGDGPGLVGPKLGMNQQQSSAGFSSSGGNNMYGIGAVGGGGSRSSSLGSPGSNFGGSGGNGFNNGNQGNSFFNGMNDRSGGGNHGNIDMGNIMISGGLNNMGDEGQQRDMMRSNSDVSMMGSSGDMIGGNFGSGMMEGERGNMSGPRNERSGSRNDMRDIMGSRDTMIGDNFRDILGGSRVTAAPPPLYPAPSFSDPPILNHSPELSLEDRKRELNLFETVNIRNDDQLKEFQSLFENGNYNVDNGLFQSWLPLKLKALGNEREAFQFLLKCRQPKAMEKRKKKRKKTEPEGPDKYDLTSQTWNDIWRAHGQTVDPVRANNTSSSNNNNNKRTRKTAKKSQDVGPSSSPPTALTPTSLCLSTFSNLVINFDHNKTCVSKCVFLEPKQQQSLAAITTPDLLSPEFVKGCLKIVNCNFRHGDPDNSKALVEMISNFANIPGVSDFCQVRLYT